MLALLLLSLFLEVSAPALSKIQKPLLLTWISYFQDAQEEEEESQTSHLLIEGTLAQINFLPIQNLS